MTAGERAPQAGAAKDRAPDVGAGDVGAGEDVAEPDGASAAPLPAPCYGPIERKVRRFGEALLRDPIETLLYVPEHVLMRYDHFPELSPALDWQERLHGLMGVPWPCDEAAAGRRMRTEVATELAERGLAVGRNTYRGYSDGDTALAEAVWCAVRHLQPETVLETGVARGVTSRIVLEALERNGTGVLWSIDLPHPFDPTLHGQTGAAVPERCRPRWHYVRGSSRRRLADVIERIGPVGLFIHDSLHTTRNTLFELERVGAALQPGGLVVVDDANMNEGFSRFLAQRPDFHGLICASADGRGVFAVGRAADSPRA